MINVTINDKKIQVKDGATVLDAVMSAGVQMTTLCHHPDLEPYGGCRMCSVEVIRNGRSWVATACNTAAEEGIVVQTDSPRALATRKVMAQLLLSRTPNVPAIQRMAATVGVTTPRFKATNPKEDCVLCGLCVRACDQKAKKHVLGFVDRGPERKVTTAYETATKECDTCNQCIPYCPTGAITKLPKLNIGQRLHRNAVVWKRARQIVQYGALAVFALFFVATANRLPVPVELVNLFSRLNPLQAIAASIAYRQPILLFLPAVLTIAATLVFGRIWCAWVCPLGAILELFGRRGRHPNIPQALRQLKYVFLFIILIMAALGSLTLMILEPITILVRGLADTVDPAISQAMVGFEKPALIGFGPIVLLLIVLLLNVVEKRFWCRYLCPLGATVGLGAKLSLFRRRVNTDSCVQCGDCAKVCPTGAINPKDITHDPAECIMCMDCATPCPKAAITFGRKPTPRWGFEFDPSRRHLLGGAVAAVAGFFLLKTDIAQAKTLDYLRPPGVGNNEDEFLSKCIRCDQCVEACPNHALHPLMSLTSLSAFWTPVLVPTLGGCSFDCNRCGQVCPSGAIPNLTLEEKRTKVIGLSVLPDENACPGCMACQKICPVKGAISVKMIDKGNRQQRVPVIDKTKCIGCGLCARECPRPNILVITRV